MKKTLLWIVGVVVVLVLGSTLFLGQIVKSGIETVGPKLVGVPVTVGSVSLSLLQGTGSLSNVVVGNPEGFKSDYAFRLKDVQLALDSGSLFSDKVKIHRVLINAPEINYELALGKSNLGTLQSTIKKQSKSSGSKDEKSSKQVTIKDFYIKNATVTTGFGKVEKSITIDEIHLKNLGDKENGADFSLVFAKILEKLIAAIASSNLDSVVGGVGQSIEEGAKSLGEGIKGLFN